MALVKPALPNVSPGQPVTAQGWNAILSAIDDLFDGVNAFGAEAVTVNVTFGSAAVLTAVVVGVPASGQPVVAVPPFGTTNSFRLTNLTPGAWTVHVAAPGFQNAQQSITVPVSAPVTISLTSNGTVPMPTLFGLNAVQALSALNSQGIAVQQILDVDGAIISHTSLPNDHTGSKVLSQFPAPGTRVTPASASVGLVLSSATVKTSKETFEKPPSFEKTQIDVVKDFEIKTGEFIKTFDTAPAGLPDEINLRREDAPAPVPGDARVFILPDERPTVGTPFVEAPRVE